MFLCTATATNSNKQVDSQWGKYVVLPNGRMFFELMQHYWEEEQKAYPHNKQAIGRLGPREPSVVPGFVSVIMVTCKYTVLSLMRGTLSVSAWVPWSVQYCLACWEKGAGVMSQVT